jgi:hypothetical protein
MKKENGLIEKISKYLSIKDSEKTSELLIRIPECARKGYLSAEEVGEICHWKSPRPINYVRNHNSLNPLNTIEMITKEAFASNDEKFKISKLDEIRGVSIPTASAILMFSNPQKYGVIDIRNWKSLFHHEYVKTNPSGINFSSEEWEIYIGILDELSKSLNVSARDIDKALFFYHKIELQEGILYKK